MWMDVMAPIFLTWAMTNCCHENEVLAPGRPPSSLFGPHTIIAVCMPHVFFVVVYVVTLLRLSGQDWFEASSPEFTQYLTKTRGGIMNTGDNYCAASMFPIVVVHHVFLGIAYSQGGLFRKPVYRSISMIAILVVVLAFVTAFVFLDDTNLNCVFRVNCSNKHSSENYVPGVSEFSVFPMSCFFGPQAQHWMPEYNITESMKEYSLPGSDKMIKPTKKCFPPEELGLKEIDGNLGPNNIFPLDWRIYLLTCGLGLGCLTNIFNAHILEPMSRIMNGLAGFDHIAHEQRVPI